jgi:hypothetical protein
MYKLNTDILAYIFAVSVFLFILFVLTIFPYAPFQDFAEWVYQSYIFNALVSGHTSSDFRLVTYPVPYALSQIMTSIVLLLFSPMVASKIVTVLYGLVILLAIRRLIKKAKLDPLVGWVFFVSVVALNSPFWNGYLGYQFGLAILLFYLSLTLEARTKVLPVLFFSLLAFFAHGFIYAAMLVFIGIYALYSRRIFQSALGLIPSICLFIWYRLKNESSGELNELFPVHTINIIAYKIYTLLKAAPYHNVIVFDVSAVDHFGSFYFILGMLIDLTFVVSLAALAYATVRRSSLQAIALKPEFAIAAILLLIALALPPVVFGIVNPGERMLYPALVAFAVAVYTELKLPLAPKAALTVALIGGCGLLAVALIPASELYRQKNESYAPQPATAQGGTSARILFGHRLMQFDSKMKDAERAWQAGTMPTVPLAFDTALILPKRK